MKQRCIIVSNFYMNIPTSRPKLVYDYLSLKYSSTILTADFVHATKSFDRLVVEDVVKLRVPGYSENFSLGRILSHLIFGLKAAKYILLSKPSLVYICLPPNTVALITALIARVVRAKVIIDIIDIWPNYNKTSGRFSNFLYEIWGSFRTLACHLSDLVILECELYRSYTEQIKTKKILVIPLAKKESDYVEFRNFASIDCLNIGYLGAFSKSYDFASLIEILKLLKKKTINVEIIGIGEYKKNFLLELKANNIPFTDYGVVYDEDKKKEILQKWHLGFNGVVDEAIVALSYKSIDYLSFGVPLLNNLKKDTWSLVNEFEIGFNYEADSYSKVASEIDNISFEDLINMKYRARFTFEKLFSWITFSKNMDSALSKLEEFDEEKFDDNF